MKSSNARTSPWLRLFGSDNERADNAATSPHSKPFLHESVKFKALYFSIYDVQSRMRISDPFALELEYTRTMMGFLLFNPAPSSIAMVGLGGGSLAKFCHRNLPRTDIRVVEINPHVIALRDDFLVPRDDARFGVIQGDGAQYVSQHEGQHDVLMIDGFDSRGLPPKLCSQRFYDDCFKALAQDGTMVANLQFGQVDYDRHLDRIHQSFDDAVLVVDDDDLNNTIVFAGKGEAASRILKGTPCPLDLPPDGAFAPLQQEFARIRSVLKDCAGGTPNAQAN
ncbi:MAG: transferase [Methyloversatilis sp.]|uniref:spermine/spermidine synthase domain-containing protein n=1 Tax=Methyloversatilis sp. TaxID=2569862 RepID=UPI0027324D43|nr:transferase [Methyloversatilis sp.]MDP3874390.1 transferase [Methyloversatilis sp.]